jgi:hypothetical protein
MIKTLLGWLESSKESFVLKYKIQFKVIIFIFFLFNQLSFVLAGEKGCNLSSAFDANLEHLLDWCARNHVPESKCDGLLDAAAELSAVDFRSKLYQIINAPKGNLTTKVVDSVASTKWQEIPKDPTKAFQKLTELVKVDDVGFAKNVKFGHNADRYFSALKSTEVKHVFEIIEKMKTMRSKSEFDLYLKNKGGEYLVSSTNKACSGKNVYAVRLSEGARMCFEYNLKESSSIKILCIGKRCYDH